VSIEKIWREYCGKVIGIYFKTLNRKWKGNPVKGTVSRDFLLPVFLMNQFPPSPRLSH
jgi:hypothetical protein